MPVNQSSPSAPYGASDASEAAAATRSGSNAAPAQGDVLFSGTYTCLQYKLIYNAGITATLEIEVKPCDGGAITPAFGTV